MIFQFERTECFDNLLLYKDEKNAKAQNPYYAHEPSSYYLVKFSFTTSFSPLSSTTVFVCEDTLTLRDVQ